MKDPLGEAHSLLQEAQLPARVAWEIVDMLLVRFSKIPERRRPHYAPPLRFRALEIKNLLGWSRTVAARVFHVPPDATAETVATVELTYFGSLRKRMG